jgi:hypothetical protein
MAKLGRPTDYNDSLPLKLFQAMTEGKSVTRFCADIDIARKTFYQWIDKYPDFSNAFEVAKEKCEAHWEEWLVNNFSNKDINSTLVKLFFANRFGWHDKSESKHEVSVRQEDAIESLK